MFNFLLEATGAAPLDFRAGVRFTTPGLRRSIVSRACASPSRSAGKRTRLVMD
jgi:hypothetical protein